MPTFKRVCVVLLLVSASACGGSSTTAPSTARVISLSGNLAFGSVSIGQKRPAALTVTNQGTSTLTVSGITVSGGFPGTSNFASTAIPAGSSYAFNVSFVPTAAQNYGGTLTVNGDQTSGTNTIAVSGTGVSMTPEAYCATLGTGAATGQLFYCGTERANLWLNNFPDGSHGLCAPSQSNSFHESVGYLAYTTNGLFGTVVSQSDASVQCNAFNVAGLLCTGFIRCTRQ